MSVRSTALLVLVAAAIVVVGAPALLAGGAGAWQVVEERARQRPFDPVAWRASTAQDRVVDDARLFMVDDLLGRGVLTGRTRGEVLALLGPARPTRYFRHYHLVYWLGPERRFMRHDDAASRWLAIHFDGNGRATDIVVLGDGDDE